MSDAQARSVVQALSWAMNGVLAADGGWGNQTIHGSTLLGIAAGERGRIESNREG